MAEFDREYFSRRLAALKTVGGDRTEALPDLPAWRKRKPPMRISQHDLITLLRNDLRRAGFFDRPAAQMPKGWKLSQQETYQAA